MASSRPIAPIPGLIQRQSLNLITGTAKSGKTELVLNQLDNYLAGNGFLGYGVGSVPVQIGAIIGSRSDEYYQRRIQKFPILNSTAQIFPFLMWDHNQENVLPSLSGLRRTYEELCEKTHGHGDVKLLLVENCQCLMPSGKWSDPKSIVEFCAALRSFTKEYDVAIIGTLGTAKMKRGEAYAQLADKVFGGGQWAHEAETLIGIERYDLNLPSREKSSRRWVDVQAEDGSEKILSADFIDDRLTILDAVHAASWFSLTADLDARLALAEPGQKFVREDFLHWGRDAEIGETKTKEWINFQVDRKLLERRGKTSSTVYVKLVNIDCEPFGDGTINGAAGDTPESS